MGNQQNHHKYPILHSIISISKLNMFSHCAKKSESSYHQKFAWQNAVCQSHCEQNSWSGQTVSLTHSKSKPMLNVCLLQWRDEISYFQLITLLSRFHIKATLQKFKETLNLNQECLSKVVVYEHSWWGMLGRRKLIFSPQCPTAGMLCYGIKRLCFHNLITPTWTSKPLNFRVCSAWWNTR